MTVKYSPRLLKILKKVDVKIRKSFKERISVFSKNANDLVLNNHDLHEPLEGLRSIDITADYRAIYEVHEGEDEFAYFVGLGTHEELYKNRNVLDQNIQS